MAAVQVTDDVRAAAGALLSDAASVDAKAFAEAVSKLPDGQAAGLREPAHNRNALHVAASQKSVPRPLTNTAFLPTSQTKKVGSVSDLGGAMPSAEARVSHSPD